MPILPALLLLTTLLACTGPAAAGTDGQSDPWEGFNRAVYAFNEDFDRAILKPLAEGYQWLLPQPARTGITNVFSNLNDVVVVVNDLLQLKPQQAASDFSRLVWNSTAGLGGLFDVATPMGLPKHDEDFGQTLAHWGMGNGPYLVLPFLGPSTGRDAVGLAVDYTQLDPVGYVKDDAARWSAVALRAVDTRANLLRASRILDQAALDPYVFLREAYLQRREYLIYDGNPPPPNFDDFDALPPDEPEQR